MPNIVRLDLRASRLRKLIGKPTGYGTGDIPELSLEHRALEVGFSRMDRCSLCGRDALPMCWISGDVALYGSKDDPDYPELKAHPIVSTPQPYADVPDLMAELHLYFCAECLVEMLSRTGAVVAEENYRTKSNRAPIPPSLRFAVLKRDNFTCQYCGTKSPEKPLHVDHRTAVAKGGGNEIENLVTSCQDCNLGKGARH